MVDVGGVDMEDAESCAGVGEGDSAVPSSPQHAGSVEPGVFFANGEAETSREIHGVSFSSAKQIV
jgi:hypothetical protein